MPLRFTTVMPPLSQTVSFRAKAPCLIEEFAESESPLPAACRFGAMCDRIATGLSEPIRMAYDEAVRVTLSEPSGNIVCRSESNWRGDRARLSLRKHFYEYEFPKGFPCRFLTNGWIKRFLEELDRDLSPQEKKDVHRILTSFAVDQAGLGQPVLLHELLDAVRIRLDSVSFPQQKRSFIMQAVRRRAIAVLGCDAIWDEGVCGKYLGFVDIRLGAVKSPIAIGLLVPPRSIRHDPDAFVITGEYGQLFGAPSFPSSVYSKFDPDDSGAQCSQACLMMALGTLSDRGVKPLGSYDLTYLGKTAQRMNPDPQSACLARSAGAAGRFRVLGFTLGEMRRLLDRPGMQTRPHYVEVPDSHTSRRMIARLFEAYLLARYPAILPVEGRTWAGMGEQRVIGHCVTVVGMRRTPPLANERARGECVPAVSELIVHDPQTQPFVKRPLADCLVASVAWSRHIARELEGLRRRAGEPITAEPDNLIQLIFVAEQKIVRTGADCLSAMKERDEATWEKYVKAAEDGGGLGDYRVLLVHRRDIKEMFAHVSYDEASFAERLRANPGQPERTRAYKIQRRIENLPADWYWSIACYDGDQPVLLWLFAATADEPSLVGPIEL